MFGAAAPVLLDRARARFQLDSSRTGTGIGLFVGAVQTVPARMWSERIAVPGRGFGRDVSPFSGSVWFRAEADVEQRFWI